MGCRSSVEEPKGAIPTSLTEEQKHDILLQIFNLYNENYFVERSSRAITKEQAKQIVRCRIQNGGVFWNFKDVEMALTSYDAKRNLKEIYEGLLSKCEIPVPVLKVLSPVISFNQKVSLNFKFSFVYFKNRFARLQMVLTFYKQFFSVLPMQRITFTYLWCFSLMIVRVKR